MFTRVAVIGACICVLSVAAYAADDQDKIRQENETKKAAIQDLMAKGQDDRVIDDLTDVVTSPKYHEIKEWANLELWNKAQRTGKLDKVVKDLERSAGKNSKDIPLQRSIAEGYLRLRDFNKVVSVYEELVNQDSTDPVLQTRLTDYYILAGQYDKAIARLEPIVTENPNDEYHSDILLNAYVSANMEDKALALFKKRLDRDPKSPGLTARYAQALETFGRTNEAIKEWEKAAQFDPSNGFFARRAADLKQKK